MTSKQMRLRDETLAILAKYGPEDPNTIIIRMDGMLQALRPVPPRDPKS